MKDAGSVFHNLRDHIETALQILQGQATGEARVRLVQHMTAEEGENQEVLAVALANAAPGQARPLQLALDHSRLLVDILAGKEIAPELGKSLLGHLLEEHDQGLLAPPGAAASSGLRHAEAAVATAAQAGWTVGSLLMGGKS